MSKVLMVQGTASSAGKTLLVAALCRIYARRGLRVAPFKAQNMALNSYVSPDGLELGRAQALQALAAGIETDVRMNPILLKPEGDSISQVVVLGKPWKRLTAGTYWKERPVLWKTVTESLDALRKEYDLIIIEGAGSPAEINLKDSDIVNMAVARYALSPVLLVGDIDRGGIFASFVGTLALLDQGEQDLVAGFVVNKFRGDVDLLKPGLDMLEERTGKACLGVIPWIGGLLLAEEDSVALELLSQRSKESFFYRASRGQRQGRVEIAVIRLPRISNFDDLDALAMEEGVQLLFIDKPEQLGDPDAVIIPGSKSTPSDLRWLHEQGLAAAILKVHERGTVVVGICAGYQMLGQRVEDPQGIESNKKPEEEMDIPALGLLRHKTVFTMEKTLTRRRARVIAGSQHPGSQKPGSALAFSNAAGEEVSGYEVHMGNSAPSADDGSDEPIFTVESDDPFRLGTRNADGSVWGTYLHGVFDEAPFRRAWLRSLGWEERGKGEALSVRRERELDRLAETVESALDMQALDRLLGL